MDLFEFKINIVYILSSRPAKASCIVKFCLRKEKEKRRLGKILLQKYPDLQATPFQDHVEQCFLETLVILVAVISYCKYSA